MSLICSVLSACFEAPPSTGSPRTSVQSQGLAQTEGPPASSPPASTQPGSVAQGWDTFSNACPSPDRIRCPPMSFQFITTPGVGACPAAHLVGPLPLPLEGTTPPLYFYLNPAMSSTFIFAVQVLHASALSRSYQHIFARFPLFRAPSGLTLHALPPSSTPVRPHIACFPPSSTPVRHHIQAIITCQHTPLAPTLARPHMLSSAFHVPPCRCCVQRRMPPRPFPPRQLQASPPPPRTHPPLHPHASRCPLISLHPFTCCIPCRTACTCCLPTVRCRPTLTSKRQPPPPPPRTSVPPCIRCPPCTTCNPTLQPRHLASPAPGSCPCMAHPTAPCYSRRRPCRSAHADRLALRLLRACNLPPALLQCIHEKLHERLHQPQWPWSDGGQAGCHVCSGQQDGQPCNCFTQLTDQELGIARTEGGWVHAARACVRACRLRCRW